MKVICCPMPTGFGVTETKTAVGTSSCHRFHMRSLVVEAFRNWVALSPLGGQCIPAEIAVAVSVLNPALAVGMRLNTIEANIIRQKSIAIVLFFIFIQFSPIVLGCKGDIFYRNSFPLLDLVALFDL